MCGRPRPVGHLRSGGLEQAGRPRNAPETNRAALQCRKDTIQIIVSGVQIPALPVRGVQFDGAYAARKDVFDATPSGFVEPGGGHVHATSQYAFARILSDIRASAAVRGISAVSVTNVPTRRDPVLHCTPRSRRDVIGKGVRPDRVIQMRVHVDEPRQHGQPCASMVGPSKPSSDGPDTLYHAIPDQKIGMHELVPLPDASVADEEIHARLPARNSTHGIEVRRDRFRQHRAPSRRSPHPSNRGRSATPQHAHRPSIHPVLRARMIPATAAAAAGSAKIPVVRASCACAVRISSSVTVTDVPLDSMSARRAMCALLGVRTEMESAAVTGFTASA